MSLLLPGAAGWYPGFLDPCCSFSSHFLSPSSLCDSICPAKVQYLPPRAAVRPLSGRWGRNTHHSWISSSAFPNSGLTHPCWQRPGVLFIPFFWCQNLGHLYRHPTGKAGCEMWRWSDIGVPALIPEMHEISSKTTDKGVLSHTPKPLPTT